MIIPYPTIDRSNIIPEEHREYGYGKGTLTNGRPFRIEGWYELNVTHLSYYLPTIGIEKHSPEDLKEILVSEGLVSFDDEKFLSSGFSGINLSSNTITDASLCPSEVAQLRTRPCKWLRWTFGPHGQ